MAARRRTDVATGTAALARALTALDAGEQPEPDDARTATRHLLEELAVRAPGRSVEVRVPPYGVVQCREGLRHTRGTPPNVVEMDPLTWLAIASGRRHWQEAVACGAVLASGERSDLSPFLPLV